MLCIAVAVLGLCQSASAASPLDAVSAALAVQFPDVPTITTTELAKRLDQPDPPVLLDVREQAEYAISQLKGARHVDVFRDLADIKRSLPLTTEIVVYCSVGYRSAEAVRELQRAGFQKVFNLSGSIFAWANEGRPVYRGRMIVLEVHPYDAIWGKFLHQDLRPKSGE